MRGIFRSSFSLAKNEWDICDSKYEKHFSQDIKSEGKLVIGGTKMRVN